MRPGAWRSSSVRRERSGVLTVREGRDGPCTGLEPWTELGSVKTVSEIQEDEDGVLSALPCERRPSTAGMSALWIGFKVEAVTLCFGFT